MLDRRSLPWIERDRSGYQERYRLEVTECTTGERIIALRSAALFGSILCTGNMITLDLDGPLGFGTGGTVGRS